MPTPVVICDDSSVARRQLARNLPASWPVSVSFASNGREALYALEEGRGRVMFLDLTMPVMDGFETLEEIGRRGLDTRVIVVSGDIQPEARRRVSALGALAFLRKPLNSVELLGVLSEHGVIDEDRAHAHACAALDDDIGQLDPFREAANVAMGQAADALARLLDVFVVLPVPNVNLLEVSELRMALGFAEHRDSVSAVCQGFIGAGISGEALLVFDDASFTDMARLLGYRGELDASGEIELLMDTANVLVGACLQGLAAQLDVSFRQSHPVVLGRHCSVEDLLQANESRWRRTLAFEFAFSIERFDIAGDLLVLITEDSVHAMEGRLVEHFQ